MLLVTVAAALLPLGVLYLLAAASDEQARAVNHGRQAAAPIQPGSVADSGNLHLLNSGAVITAGLLVADTQTYTQGLTVREALTVTGDLTVTHGLTVGMGLTVTGNLVVTGGLWAGVLGETPAETDRGTPGDLVITGPQTLAGPYRVAGSLVVTDGGELTVNGGLIVTGEVAITGALAVQPFRIYLPAVAQNILIEAGNGRFEMGPVLWHQFSTHNLQLILPANEFGIPAHSGEWIASLGRVDDEVSMISQGISIAKETSCLIYWQWTTSYDICDADFGGVGINGRWVDVHSLCAGTSTAAWVRRQINMEEYSVEMTTTATALNFAVLNDYSVPSALYIDDVAFYPTELCGSNEVPAPADSRDSGTNASRMIGQPIIVEHGVPSMHRTTPSPKDQLP